MGGSIRVESQPGEGSTFSVFLPLTEEKTLARRQGTEDSWSEPVESSIDRQPVPPTSIAPSKGLPQVLIIEDNPDVHQYLASVLGTGYHIQVAEDGNAGINLAFQSEPDLIICDVMMPGKDGFEVCRTLKSDAATNHIPVIMLTAKVDLESKLEGIERGADLYLPKPFNEQELLRWVENRLRLHRELQQKYNSPEWLARSFVDAGQEVSESERMMQNFIQLVKTNIDNSDLNISYLCKELLVTEATLGRKVKSYTGQSVGRYITSIRMAVARQLLKDSGLNISEIAYRVGYQDPNTFSRYFKKDAGISPSGFRKRRKL